MTHDQSTTTMISAQQPLNSTVQARYHRLAGPFADPEEHLLRRILEYMRITQARVLTVSEPEGVTLWRLASECETMEQTENRLRRIGASVP
jgi:hypothetical protein